VLTAAHCISPGGTAYVVALNAIDQNSLSSAEIINVRKSIPHPQYFSTRPNNDIAGLVLQNNAQTPPVTIANTADLTNSSKVTLVGFGNNDNQSTKGFGIKRKVTVDITSMRINNSEDLNREEGIYGYESDLEIVAGGNGFDTCNGDSGGPIYVSLPGSIAVAGLTSRASRNSVNPCGDGGIYTRLDVHATFINDIINTI
jgi:endonuclease G